VKREDVLASVGEQLISIRTGTGLSLERAAALAGMLPERLAEAEGGEFALAEDELQRLAEAYDVAVTAFFGGRVTPVSYLFGA
jgi:transcriptional regulator with XRE-family HTH domain